MATWESNGYVTDDVTHVTPKGQGHDPNMFGTHYLGNGWSGDSDLVIMECL